MSLKLVPLLAALAALPLSPGLAADTDSSSLSAAELRLPPSLEKMTIADLEARTAQGDLRAQAELAARYGRGDGVTADVPKAISLLQDGVAKNDPDAQYWLGTAYSAGTGVAKSDVQAALLFEKSALQGHRGAQYMMGILISSGQAGFSESWSGAFPYFWKAADQGYSPAEFMLGYIYQEGKAVDVNPQVAAYWYRRTISRLPNTKAAFNLARMIGQGSVAWLPTDPVEPPSAPQGPETAK